MTGPLDPVDGAAGEPGAADGLLPRGRLEAEDVRAAAAWLAERQRRAPGVPDAGAATARELERELADCVGRIRGRLPELARDPMREIERAQRDFLAQQRVRLLARAQAGRLRILPAAPLGLTDLRRARAGGFEAAARNPRSGDAPRDACVDAAALALELADGERGDLAERLLSAYAAAADDFELYGVIDFYERRCALLRVVARPSEALGREEVLAAARRLLLVALATRRRPLLPPVVVAVGGLVASGKSTVSKALSDRLGAPRIEADRARTSLLGAAQDEPLQLHESHWAQAVAPGADEVYTELFRRAAFPLDSGRAVVLDACFPSARERGGARSLARSCGLPLLFVECRVGRDVSRERLAERDALAGHAGWQQIYEDLAKLWEPTSELAPSEHLVLDTTRPLAENMRALDARLPTWPAGLGGS